MRKPILLLTFFTISLFTACAKPKQNASASQAAATSSASQPVAESAPAIDPKIQKLNRVLMSMTDRCKEAIPNGDPNEFLADLEKVLQIEKAFPSDDLSLYYLIDKKHTVGADYEPKHLRKLVANDDYIINKTTLALREDADDALHEMARAAKKDGVTLDVSSTYRSYETQERTFNYWVSVDGLEEAERESARPGTSQHQLGAAVDFGNIEDSYALTDGCKWLNAHANEYGWSLSFPQGYEDVTGYRWECWHFRYIGVEACRFQNKWFSGIQQFMFEFIDAWKKMD